MYQYLKRQLKTPICFGSFGIHPQGGCFTEITCDIFVCVVGVWRREIWTVIWNGMSNLYGIVPKLQFWNYTVQILHSISYCIPYITLSNTDYAHKTSQIISVKHV